MFGFQCWQSHPRKLVWAYLISILFLACSVQSRVSNEFLTFSGPVHSILDLVGERWRTVVHESVRLIFHQAASIIQQRAGLVATFFKPFFPILGNITVLDGVQYLYPVTLKVLSSVEVLDVMVKKRLFRVIFRPEDPITAIMNEVQGTDKAVLIQDRFWCRTTLSDEFSEMFKGAHSFRVWNSLATRVFRLFSLNQAGGFEGREERLKVSYILSQRKVKWKIVGDENEPKGININSPVGFALAGVLTANVTGCLILVFKLYLAHKRRIAGFICEAWMRVSEGMKALMTHFLISKYSLHIFV